MARTPDQSKLWNDLFFAPGGIFGGPVNRVTTETQVPDWVDDAAQSNLATVDRLASLPYVPYTGPTLAGFTPDQQAAFQAVRDMQGRATGDINAAVTDAQNLPQTINTLYSPMVGATESDVFKNTMRTLAITRQGIRANAVAQNMLGGSREAINLARAGSDAQRQLGTDIGDIASGAWMSATQKALSSLEDRAQLATQQQTAGLTDANALYQVGTQAQTQQQSQYVQDLLKFQAQQNYPYQQLGITQSALAGSPYGATTVSSQPYHSNPTASALGMATSLLGTAAAIPGALAGIGSIGSSLGLGSGLSTAMSGVAPIFAPIGIGSLVGGLVGGQQGQIYGTAAGGVGSLALLALMLAA